MKNHKFIFFSAILFLSITAMQLHAKSKELPEVTEDGLHRVHDSKLAIVYAEPGADLSQYTKVQLMDAYVAFKKNWLRDQRKQSIQKLKVTTKDVEKIKNQLATEFNEVFVKALEENGYEISDQAGEDVLLVRPAIINLDVNAPDTPTAGRSYQYTSSAGEMTLYLELYDSVTGDMIAKALDRRVDNSRSGYYTWTTSVSNATAARKILGGWAEILIEALDEAHQYKDNSPEQ